MWISKLFSSKLTLNFKYTKKTFYRIPYSPHYSAKLRILALFNSTIKAAGPPEAVIRQWRGKKRRPLSQIKL